MTKDDKAFVAKIVAFLLIVMTEVYLLVTGNWQGFLILLIVVYVTYKVSRPFWHKRR